MLVRIFFFFFNDTATTEIYTLSLHDALPISKLRRQKLGAASSLLLRRAGVARLEDPHERSEEHTSELQSRSDLVCRLLLEKKKAAKQPSSTVCRAWTTSRRAKCRAKELTLRR